MKDLKKVLQIAQDLRRELKEGGVSKQTGDAFEAILSEFDEPDEKSYRLQSWDKFILDKDLEKIPGLPTYQFLGPDGTRWVISPALYNALRHITRKKS